MRVLYQVGVLALMLSGLHQTSLAQSAPDRYWVQFEGKVADDLPEGYSTSYLLNSPEAFLSERSLARRFRQNIAVTERDMPIPPDYVAAIKAMPELKVILSSRWFNAVTVATTDSTFDPFSLTDLPFVIAVKSVLQIEQDAMDLDPIAVAKRSTRDHGNTPAEYGSSWKGLEQLHGDWLHGLGFRGENMWIGVLDAGFEYVESLPVFERAWQEGRILEGMDAMNSQGGLFAHHRHGTSVLGTMVGFLEDSLIGTAPDATYILYRTEDAYSEYLIEEDYWVAAAEHADSVGVDLINTSLGYSLFDDSTMNHTPDDLNGVTARISQAMTWAAERGILCITSAGNSGNSAWHSITTPADAHGILSVGAVDADGQHASFSGWGPASDGRIKPEIMALGVQAAYPNADSTIRHGNGTSFSSPILCGAAACLWQAFPAKSAAEIRAAIIASAHLSASPNDSMGYGIPNLQRAFEFLDEDGAATWFNPSTDGEAILVFPNPTIEWPVRWQYTGDRSPNEWRIVSTNGKLIATGHIESWVTQEGVLQGWLHGPAQLGPGAYLLEWLESGEHIGSSPWIWSPQ
ncbi:MAG: S8 family serine peptidase [Flavobacteriales bacterium]|nr:S8 family serine peptidase [Flavobacteriales bacterium]